MRWHGGSFVVRINKAGLELIKRNEGCVLKAYPDPASPRAVNKRKTGVDNPKLSGAPWTIGYGHTRDVKEGQVISLHQAEEMLKSDLELFYEPDVAKLAPKATENQFAALVSFAYNLGVDALAKSSLLKKFKAGDVQGAAAEFMKWKYAQGQVLPGLVKRRAEERSLFLQS